MAFAATRIVEIVKKTTGGLVWKQWAMNRTRRANVKKRARRVAQVEAIMRACEGPPPPTAMSQAAAKKVEEIGASHSSMVEGASAA
ncbi:hypothetical protein KP509_30G020700 [Ceratopteris richardii]|uniref:Uncharacterized protein n=1 Tax=Ceratopteris richardii TaxID=49495 RepID=A0A8T2R1M5_CERRI|nr:hypothetical protein KP509_30G020700 [Ceratopteris richardii]